MKRKNKLLYISTLIIIIIVFLVIFLSSDCMKKIIYVDNLLNQPINNIRNVVKEQPIDNDNKQNNNKNNNNNGNKNNVKPNSESPIKYVYEENEENGNYIYLINQFPIKDELGKTLEGNYEKFDFKLEFKNAALGASYDITLKKTENSDLENSWIKVYLERDKQVLNECVRNTGRIKTFNDYLPYSNRSDEIIIYQGVVNKQDIQKGYHDYTLRMWISEDVKVVNEEYKSKTIGASVNVYAMGN